MSEIPAVAGSSTALAPSSIGPVGPDPIASHGTVPPRGVLNVPRSTTETGRFGRLFRGLPALELDDDQLHALADAMIDQPQTPGGGWGNAPDAGDSPIGSGWTYLAQFVDHDITFDPTSMLDHANDPDALENFRTPRFDLDCLYGLGPQVNPWLYQRDDPFKLLVGANPSGLGFAPVDLSRNQEGRALIGDPRNEVHLIIAQLHLVFVRFHNAVVDLVRAQPGLVSGVPATPVGGWGGGTPTGPNQPTFGQIVTLVRWHYQWLVLMELLPRIVGPETHGAVVTRGPRGRLVSHLELYSIKRRPWMPVEFSAGAYRFGHTLVRPVYNLNANVQGIPVFSPAGDSSPTADLRGFRPLPESWEIEWHRFFEGLPGHDASETQTARKFDTLLSPSLSQLPSSVAGMPSLAFLNLKRGVALQLPSGEDVAAKIASELGLPPDKVAVATGLAHPTPLWFWILTESAVKASGAHLGPVGGRIVAEVLVGLARNDRSSFLKAQPDWLPTLGATGGSFAIGDLIALAAA